MYFHTPLKMLFFGLNWKTFHQTQHSQSIGGFYIALFYLDFTCDKRGRSANRKLNEVK